jgi:ABC-2 type transport system permease protein
MSALAGTGTLARLALRRDRVLMPVWILVLVAVVASSASASVALYPTVESRVQAAETANATPALVALYGRVYDTTSLGGISLLKLTGFGAVLVAILMAMTVVRHTRGEEEAGRLELMGAGVMGRYAPLASALLLTLGSSIALGVLTGLALAGVGLPAAGSLAFGLAWACAGATFAAVAAVTAQLSASARTANGLWAAALAAAYLLRALGDTAGDGGSAWLSWLSPIGWSQQIRPFAGDRWPVALLPAASVVVLTAVAIALVARRDVGAGLVAARPGPAAAPRSLRSPLALAWRLQRGQLLAWLVASALLGTVLGNIASDVGGLLDSPQAKQLVLKLGGVQSLTDAFLATEFGFVGVIVSVYGIQAAMRLRAEESALRAEPLLATAVTRSRWLWSHTTVALAGATVVLAVGGLMAGLSHGASTGQGAGAVPPLLAAALVQVPAVWVLVGLVVTLFGVAPRLVVGAWVALVLFLLLGELGALLGLSPHVIDVSPFAHVPRLPGGDFSAAPVGWLTVVAAALLLVGTAAFRRRDLD